jgi:muramoyltetrapeptide carboxypeptidase LdcA involved in peptidoglycan recycling
MGFEPVLGENVLKRNPSTRRALMTSVSSGPPVVVTDPQIQGVVCARGGEGATSLLALARGANVEPRVFCGYST